MTCRRCCARGAVCLDHVPPIPCNFICSSTPEHCNNSTVFLSLLPSPDGPLPPWPPELLQVAVWLVAHPRQMGNMWNGQRPGMQDISGGANFANKADNGIIVHRDWAKLKELQERSAAASGKQPGKKGKAAGSGATGGEAESEGKGQESKVRDIEEFEVQIHVEKVGDRGGGRWRVDGGVGWQRAERWNGSWAKGEGVECWSRAAH